eukprot:10812569-Heterocapsa_arctica.AAC.1
MSAKHPWQQASRRDRTRLCLSLAASIPARPDTIGPAVGGRMMESPLIRDSSAEGAGIVIHILRSSVRVSAGREYMVQGRSRTR